MKDAIRKFLIGIFGLCVSIVTQLIVMIYGWGLVPQSWPIIICMGIVGNILALLILEAAK